MEFFLLLTEVSIFPNSESLLFQRFSLFRMRDDGIILDFRIAFKVLEKSQDEKAGDKFFPGDLRLKILVDQ